MFDPRILLHALHHHQVRFIIIGGVAAELHGSEQRTGDLDICYARDDSNIAAVVAALAALHPRIRGKNLPKNLPFMLDEKTVRAGLNFTLETDAGPIDLLGEIQGLGSYRDALQHTVEFELYSIPCRVLDIDTVILTKKVAGRPKDVPVILELEAIKALQKKP